MKDNFSAHSDAYAKYRPTYPAAFFDWLNQRVPHKQTALDCGTGNGQVARELSKTFSHVYATDISQNQLDHAFRADNIFYSLQPAEKTTFKNQFFDLIIVAQAIHWFDFEKFYAEVRRTSKPDGMICAVGYGKLEISPEIDVHISDFYHNIIGPFWDKERRYVDENYQTITFPFEEIPAPKFHISVQWNLENLIGYLETWSAVKHFQRQNGFNPVDALKPELEKCWVKEMVKDIRFPLFLRVGKV